MRSSRAWKPPTSLTLPLDALFDGFGYKPKDGEWRKGSEARIRTVTCDSHVDPYLGQGFTLEFEKPINGRFNKAVYGVVRLWSLCTVQESLALLEVQRAVAADIHIPDRHIQLVVPHDVRPAYLAKAEPSFDPDRELWMRVRQEADGARWAHVLMAVLPGALLRFHATPASQLDVMGPRLVL